MDHKSEQVDKPWLKSYAPGIPSEINPDTFQSLTEMFEKSCEDYADRPAFYGLGKTLTYAELHEQCAHFAAYLQNDLKLKKGDRIAIMLPNTLQYPVVLFGAFMAGCIVVNVNPLYTASELTHQLNDSGATTIVVLSNFANTVEKAIPKMPQLKNIIVTHLGDYLSAPKALIIHLVLKYLQKKIPNWSIPNAIMFKDALSSGRNKNYTPVAISNDEVAFLQYTGGTTGVSKGAELTHRNMLANLEQATTFYSKVLRPGCEITITPLPLYHIFSLLANGLLCLRLGGLNVLIPNPRDLPSVIKELKKHPFTQITGVNTLYNALVNHPQFKEVDFSHLRIALGGGMPVQEAVAQKWKKLTGTPLTEGYGLTETSPLVTVNPPTLTDYNGSIGLPVPSTDVAILDENHQPLPLGESGEIAVKGPQVMRGYWNMPDENKKVFTEDGWLLTGDIGKMDEDGYIYILDRKKDMIVVSGFKVYPTEIEGIIAKMPGILECAIVGIPDDNSGEAVKAFIVKTDKNINEKMVMEYCREYLTAYKVPHSVEFRDELPKTNVGKILRRALRDE